MIKHVGRHDNKKIAIMFKQVPDEDHMCLVVYTESLPSKIHDELMSVLESELGQSAENLADAAYKHTMSDGVNCLTAIHKGGYMKKVQTNQVIVTANVNSSCRLDELNNILAEMATGEAAVKRLSEMDSNAGMRNIDNNASKTTSADLSGLNTSDVLENTDIATNLKEQAKKLRSDAKALTVEATRLDKEAKALLPKAKNVRKPRATKKTATQKA